MNGESTHELLSQEGTTQGCPLAMAMYALGRVPLTRHLHTYCNQIWYADDATGCDSLSRLKAWHDELLEQGPIYGYFPSPAKCILVTKPDKIEQAIDLFKMLQQTALKM